MPFKDLPEGTTHYFGDGCKEEHGRMKQNYVKCKTCSSLFNAELTLVCPRCENKGKYNSNKYEPAKKKEKNFV